MGEVKQIENWTYYFYNNMINVKDFESNLPKIDEKPYKANDIYYIRYITIRKIGDCKNIYSVNLLYLLSNQASGCIEEENT